jgi:hypothetical protein
VAERNGNAKGDFSAGSAPSYSHARRWKLVHSAAGVVGGEMMAAVRFGCRRHGLGANVQIGSLPGGSHVVSLFSKLFKTSSNL